MQHKSTIAVRRFVQAAGLTVIVLLCSALVMAQQTTGNIKGVVKDPNGAVVTGAKVTITNSQTNVSATTQSGDAGEYQFSNLLVGSYKMTVEAPNFKTLTLNDVKVQLNQTIDIPASLTVGATGETIEVSAGGAELVDTTTTTLSKAFSERQVVELAQTATGLGVYNLALIAPNVSSTGGVGVGQGGSVGGQRPRNNNFVIDGVDNNDKAVTGPQVYISPETVSEFSLLSNQFSAEFSHSTGGQFITVSKTGTNQYHGTAYAFFRNRHLSAMDSLNIANGLDRSTNPRSDYARYGGNVGGPILKDKLFFFTSFERLQTGNSGGAGGIDAPTAAGFTTLSSIAGLSATNLGVFKQFVPVAPFQGVDSHGNPTFITVNGTSVATGPVNIVAPSFTTQKNFVVNIDYNQNANTQHRGRFIMNNNDGIDANAALAAFFTPAPSNTRLFSYTLLHTFSPHLTSETRLAYRRYVAVGIVPNISFPGLDQFPNVGLLDLGLDIGPDPNQPQGNVENNYQIVENMTYVHGNHTAKFGADFRKLISPQSFVQRQRGDYQYGTTDLFLRDVSPDKLGERSVGVSPYYGDQRLWFLFAQDDWRFRSNLTLNLGINYSYQELPFSARQQKLNSLSSVPGLIEFNEPKSQKSNFAPKVGFAYSPNYDSGWLGKIFGGKDQSAIRGGFSMGYDVIFDNLYILSLPPQFNQTVDIPSLTNHTPNFLKNGGIPPTPVPVGTDPVAARAATTAFIPDQMVPYSLTYTLSYQRQFAKSYALELRYLGTRGVHLLTQNRFNVQNRVTPTAFLPTFTTAPSQAAIDAATLTLNDLNNRPRIVPAFSAAGFNSNIVGFPSNGNSTYNGFSAQLTKRFSNGWQGSAAYTWSHLIDDTTAEVFSTVLSPRRVQDFRNLVPERSDSALDRRHRFVLSSTYDLPFFNKSTNWASRSLLGGWSLAGTLAFESGEKATVLSGLDSNLNGDAAGDRSIFNPGGVPGTSSVSTPLLKTCTSFNPDGTCAISNALRTVGYLVKTPSAQYWQAGAGALSTTGRNTLQLPGINNLDFSVFKNFRVTESMKVQFRVDMFNAFNHAQYTPGSVNGGEATSETSLAATNLITVGTNTFNRPEQTFSNHPRVIQMMLRFSF